MGSGRWRRDAIHARHGARSQKPRKSSRCYGAPPLFHRALRFLKGLQHLFFRGRGAGSFKPHLGFLKDGNESLVLGIILITGLGGFGIPRKNY